MHFFFFFFFGGGGGKQGALWSMRKWWIAVNDLTGEGCNHHLITKNNAWQKYWPIRAPHLTQARFQNKNKRPRCVKVGNGSLSLFSTVDKFTQGSGLYLFSKVLIFLFACTIYLHHDKGDIQSTILPWARLGYEEVNSQWGAEYRTGSNQLILYPTIPMHSSLSLFFLSILGN